MPLFSKYYGLEAFILGDSYSSAADKRRMEIIDRLMKFFSDLFGDGVIDGFDLSYDGNEIEISEGLSLINCRVKNKISNFKKELNSDGIFYIFVQERKDEVGNKGGVSDYVYVEYNDSENLSVPTNVSLVSKSYNFVTISWDDVSLIDFDKYIIYRSTNNITYEKIGTSYEEEFTDTNVEQNTNYYYKVSSLDVNENESDKSSELNINTDLDLTVPLNTNFLNVFGENGYIFLNWDKVDNILEYIIEVYYNGNLLHTKNVSQDKESAYIDSLDDNKRYLVNFKTKTVNNVYSEVIEKEIYINRKTLNHGIKNIDFSYEENGNDFVTMEIQSELDPLDLITNIDYYKIKFYSKNKEYNFQSFKKLDGSKIKLLSYNEGSNNIYENIKANEKYILEISRVVGGKESSYFYKIIKTPYLGEVFPPSNLSFSLQDNAKIILDWSNPVYDFFDSINMKIEKNSIETFNSSIDKSNYFIIEDIEEDDSFDIEIRSKSIFGDYSDVVNLSFDIGDFSQYSKDIKFIENKSIASGDRFCHLTWNDNDLIKEYKIYRQEDSSNFSVDDFVLIGSTFGNFFYDYDVTNGVKYLYYISGVDYYNNEGLSPQNGSLSSVAYLKGNPNDGDFNKVENLSALKSGNDIILSWDLDISDNYDGFEILYSKDDSGNFIPVDYLSKEESSYTHENVLIKNGKYSYIVRKVLDEVDVVVSESSSSPMDSILIYQVEVSGGVVLDHEDERRDLKNARALIEEESDKRLLEHNHLINRIDLSDNIKILMKTDDGIRYYFDNEDIEGSFNIYIDGEVEESEIDNIIDLKILKNGFYPYSYSVDNNFIVFDKILYKNGEKSLYKTSPNVYIIFDNISEVKEHLKTDNVKEIFANQIKLGLYDEENYYHNGYEVKPSFISKDIFTNDNIFYEFPNKKNIDSIFYDVVKIDDDFYSASSNGVLKSSNGGIDWDIIFTYKKEIFKYIFYDNTNDVCYSISNSSVFISYDKIYWKKIDFNIEGVKIIRDYVLNNGDLSIATDVGLFLLKSEEVVSKNFVFQNVINDSFNSNFYSINMFDSKFYSSNENFIYTSNDGENWTQFQYQIDNIETVRFLESSNDHLYAVTKNEIFKTDSISEFEKIYTSDLTITNSFYKDKFIFIQKNIYNYIQNDKVFPKKLNKDITGLSIIEDKLYIFNETDIKYINGLNDFVEVRVNKDFIDVDLYLGDNRFDDVYYLNDYGFYLNDVNLGDIRYVDEFKVMKSGVNIANKIYNTNISVFDNDNMFVNYVKKDTLSTMDYLEYFSSFDVNLEESDVEVKVYGLINFDFSKNKDVIKYMKKNNSPYSYYLKDNKVIFDFPLFGDDDLVYPYVDKPKIVILLKDKKILFNKNEVINNFMVKTINEDNSFLEEAKRHREKAKEYLIKLNKSDKWEAKDVQELYDNFESYYARVSEDRREELLPEFNVSMYSNNDNSLVFDISNGVLKFDNSLNKYSLLNIVIEDFNINNIGDHKKVEDNIFYKNSGLSLNMSNVLNSNFLESNRFINKNIKDIELYNGNMIDINSELLDFKKSSFFYKDNSSFTGKNIFNKIDSMVLIEDYIYIKNDVGIFNINKDTYEESNIVDDEIVFLSEEGLFSDGKYIKDINGNSFDTYGISGKILSLNSLNNKIICVTSSGVFIYNEGWKKWTNILEKDFNKVYFSKYLEDTWISRIDDKIYLSINNLFIEEKDLYDDIYDVCYFRGKILFGTKEGLKTDNNSIYNDSYRLYNYNYNSSSFEESIFSLSSFGSKISFSSKNKIYTIDSSLEENTIDTDNVLKTVCGDKVWYTDGKTINCVGSNYSINSGGVVL